MANLWQLRQTIQEKKTSKQTKKSAKNFSVTYLVDLLRKKFSLGARLSSYWQCHIQSKRDFFAEWSESL